MNTKEQTKIFELREKSDYKNSEHNSGDTYQTCNLEKPVICTDRLESPRRTGLRIRNHLEIQGCSVREFALRMGMSQQEATSLLDGYVELTSDLADRIGYVTGMSGVFWMNQELLTLRRITTAEQEKNMKNEFIIARRFPYKEMAALGWVENTTAKVAKVRNLRMFFRVADLTYLEKDILPYLNKLTERKGKVSRKDYAVAAGIQYCRNCHGWRCIQPPDMLKIMETVDKIKTLLQEEPFFSRHMMRSMLMECGVMVGFVPPMAGIETSAVMFYCNRKYMIALNEGEGDQKEMISCVLKELIRFINNRNDAEKGNRLI